MSSEIKSHYVDLTVKAIIAETHNSISIAFKQPVQKFHYKSGQFLNLIVNIKGHEIRRAYSLCSSPSVDEDLIITVKRVRNGLMSNWLADNVRAGDQLKVMEPVGHFTTEFRKENKRHLVMFSRGSGITPILSLIKSLLTEEPASICSLIYYNRDIDNIIFHQELERWKARYGERFNLIHVLETAPTNWQGHSGLLNLEMLEKLMTQLPDWGFSRTMYFMCGPETMMKNVETFLMGQDVPLEKILREKFVQGSGHKENKMEPTTSGRAVRLVTIKYDDKEHSITVHPSSTILQAALDQDVDLPYSCQSGYCSACRGKALSGNIIMDEQEALSVSERKEGYVLTCVGHPLSDDVVIEIG